jgi:H+/gluconate symporter-like permease
MAMFGYWWLKRMLTQAKARGERFEARPDDPVSTRTDLPHPALSTIPLAVVLAVSFIWHDELQTTALILALLAGSATVWLTNLRFLRQPGKALADASSGALIAIGNTAAVVGFGAVAKLAPAFAVATEVVTHLPGSPLISAAVAVSLIAAMTGSASGGQAIALPILAPHFLAQGVNPEQLHRVVAISSGVLDSLPHNGYVVTTIRAICGETHQAAYGPVAALTVAVPLLGLVLCIALFAVGL